MWVAFFLIIILSAFILGFYVIYPVLFSIFVTIYGLLCAIVVGIFLTPCLIVGILLFFLPLFAMLIIPCILLIGVPGFIFGILDAVYAETIISKKYGLDPIQMKLLLKGMSHLFFLCFSNSQHKIFKNKQRFESWKTQKTTKPSSIKPKPQQWIWIPATTSSLRFMFFQKFLFGKISKFLIIQFQQQQQFNPYQQYPQQQVFFYLLFICFFSILKFLLFFFVFQSDSHNSNITNHHQHQHHNNSNITHQHQHQHHNLNIMLLLQWKVFHNKGIRNRGLMKEKNIQLQTKQLVMPIIEKLCLLRNGRVF